MEAYGINKRVLTEDCNRLSSNPVLMRNDNYIHVIKSSGLKSEVRINICYQFFEKTHMLSITACYLRYEQRSEFLSNTDLVSKLERSFDNDKYILSSERMKARKSTVHPCYQ